VYANKIAAIEDPAERERYIADLRADYETDIDFVRLASELVVDDIVQPGELRTQLIARYRAAASKDRSFSRRRHGVTPV
jgi:acetyl-CoA carboxylase carboxyltransferase component